MRLSALSLFEFDLVQAAMFHSESRRLRQEARIPSHDEVSFALGRTALDFLNKQNVMKFDMHPNPIYRLDVDGGTGNPGGVPKKRERRSVALWYWNGSYDVNFDLNYGLNDDVNNDVNDEVNNDVNDDVNNDVNDDVNDNVKFIFV
ncbi:hypothetical protein Bpfe_028899 [Biomphalaria pfeifferi]|uniref:Uncharacterized protein n=1 Tax=Biomphalaria pfeifferi TaxID=112525 RepID=A0AAD8EV98_BIOPF|nr:hypothetical protein Bpfe_028899 [Biomphalaria pfeifferi]